MIAKKISPDGIQFLKDLESFSSKAYWDVKGWSIGFGHFMGPTKIMDNITLAQGLALLAQDLKIYEGEVNRRVKVALNQNQYDSLVSFVYNVGGSNFATSTLLKKLNAGDYQGAADQFPVWNKVRDSNNVLVANAYQTQRRAKERQLFLS